MAWTNLDFTAFQTLTATQMDQMYANMAGLKDGTLFDAGAIGTADIANGAVTPEKLLASTGTSWAWQSWTPTYTNLTVGNGTVKARYVQIGKTVHFRFWFDLGTTSSIGNDTKFSLPVAAHADYADAYISLGTAVVRDASAANEIPGVIYAENADTAFFIWPDWNGSANDPELFPITEDSSDFLTASGTYEAA